MNQERKKFTEMDWTEISRYGGVMGIVMFIVLAFQVGALNVAHMTPVVPQPTPEYCKSMSQFVSDLISINISLIAVVASLFGLIGELARRVIKLETNRTVEP